MRWRRRRRLRNATRGSSASSSARPTRIWRSACAARASCRWTGASGRFATKPASIEKFGVPPASIPDYLALVGDASDGYPGLKGWGAKSAAAVLAKFGHIEAIPADPREWRVNASSAGALAATLTRERETRAALPHASPPCARIFRCSNRSTNWSGSGPTPAYAALAATLEQAARLST